MDEDALTADAMLRMTDPARTECRHEHSNVYIHTTDCLWLNLFCHRCDHRLRGIEPPRRGVVTRSRWCSGCHTHWVLLVTLLDRTDEQPLRQYQVQWAPMEGTHGR